MPLIEVFADGQNQGTCRSCGKPIWWAKTLKGKAMPFDAEIVPVQSRQLETMEVVVSVDTSMNAPHHSTCPQGHSWRRK